MGDIWLPRKGGEEVGKKRGKWERKGGSGETGGIKRAKDNKEKKECGCKTLSEGYMDKESKSYVDGKRDKTVERREKRNRKERGGEREVPKGYRPGRHLEDP